MHNSKGIIMYWKALKILFPAIKANLKWAILVLGGLFSLVGISVFFSYWRKWFYNALQAYDSKNVMFYLFVFGATATVYVIVSGFTSYWTRFLEFGIREFLFDKYSKLWDKANVKNPEQRLSEDTIQFGRVMISFIRAVINATIMLPVFLFILMSVANIWVALLALGYAVLGTYFSRKVAQPLVDLEFIQQQREAEFRKQLTYAVDSKSVFPTLEEIKRNWLQLAKKNKYLSFYTSGYLQMGVIIPFIVLLPLYLSKKILLGDFFQITSAMDRVLESLSILVESRDIMVELQMVTQRLSQLEEGDDKNV